MTPQQHIDLQHDTWAYELKVWAEARNRKPHTRISRLLALFGILRAVA